MKAFLNTLFIFSAIFIFWSCEKSTSDEFNDANGNVKIKLIKTISIVSAQNTAENKVITFSYDSSFRLNTVTDGDQTSVFVYENNKLATITGQNDNLTIEELYQSPYDAFDTGDVLQYDSKGNPIKLLFKEEKYDYNTGNYVIFDYTADVSYDEEHNPYYYTLEAGGLIEVMDDVKFNFSPNAQNPEIVLARKLLPLNNPSKLIYKNEDGSIVSQVLIDYVYDQDNYPTQATITATSLESGDTSVYTASYSYITP